MAILAAIVLVVASVIGLFAAPSLLIYLRYTYPLTWWTELKTVQILAGASTYSLALKGKSTIGHDLLKLNKWRLLSLVKLLF
jgi:hypothetical protein